MGREWFPLTFRNPAERWDGVNAAAPVLESFLDAELARHQLAPSALALVGFALIFVFLFLAMEAVSKAGKPKDAIKPAANAAWSMKDAPPAGNETKGRQ